MPHPFAAARKARWSPITPATSRAFSGCPVTNGPAGEVTESALKPIDDLDRLDRLADAILTAKSWAELLATP
jgi:hypothetical protein